MIKPISIYKKTEALQQSGDAASGSAVTIGNFDGCHRGHQQLFRKICQLRDQFGVFSMALTFDPNPKIFFHDVDNFNLFTNEQKIKAFAESGLDGGFFQRVNQDFLSTPYQEFYHNLLRSGLNANHIVIGENFRFGHKRTGTIDWLRDTARSEGVSVYVEPPFLHDGQIWKPGSRPSLDRQATGSDRRQCGMEEAVVMGDLYGDGR